MIDRSGAWFWILALLLVAEPARAACNNIPPSSETFRGATGSVSRPFARGGAGVADDVELSPSCGSPRLPDTNGDETTDAKDVVVSVFFKPPRGGPGHVVVLGAGASCGELKCDGAKVSCVDDAAAGLFASADTGRVRFRFPDTDGLLPPSGDGRGLTGPVAIAVTSRGKPLPCEIRTKSCANLPASPARFFCVDQLFAKRSGADGCKTDRASIATEFPAFTALPPSSDYRRVCSEAEGEPGCAGDASAILMAVDEAGNVGLPMRWGTALRDRSDGRRDRRGRVRKADRNLLASTAERRRKGGGELVDVPNATFLASFTEEGRRWDRQPLFEPVPKASSGRSRELTLRGTADELASVLWFYRRMPWRHACKGGPRAAQACDPKEGAGCPAGACVQQPTAEYYTCRGGGRAGQPCTRSSDCGRTSQAKCRAGAACVVTATGAATSKACKTDAECSAAEECGPGLFEFRDRMQSGVGPVVLDRDASPSNPGVCRRGPKQGEACTSKADCDGERCVRFRAEAGKYRSDDAAAR